MYSLRQPILQNPFHPLDLSPEDLLRIYNRFQESRKINKNPQQQLPIDTISQLISSLKGIKPSYIQKCISQSFIKSTISWNDFLTLLDHESQIRQKILDWVLFYYDGYIKKYKLQKYMPIKTKTSKTFDFITFMKLTSIGQQKYCIIEVDHQKLFLIDINNGEFNELDQFSKKNTKMNLQSQPTNIKNNSKIVNISQLFSSATSNKKSKLINPSKYQSEKLISTHSNFQQAGNIRSNQFAQDDEMYFKKQRKNIHSVFSIFKNLSIQDSVKLAHLSANKFLDKSFDSYHANIIKDSFADRIVSTKQKFQQITSKEYAPFERAKKKLQSLYEQKSSLTYNPYRVKKSFLSFAANNPLTPNFSNNSQTQKKNNHERKEKSYILQSVVISFCQEICCLALAYHDMQILIVKVGRDFNKVCFQQQDSVKINLQRDHKKNQVIESAKFYHHTIRDKWFLLILIRVQYKTQGKSNVGQSFVIGFEIQIQQNKRKIEKSYKFKCNQQKSTSNKKENFSLKIQKFQATILQVQPRNGIHLASFNGKYIVFREEYIQNLENPSLTKYWKQTTEQKFKNSNLSLCCLSICSESNKVLFGTNNGNIIIYDSFSHNFKIKKISSYSISKVLISCNKGFILTRDQKIIILSLSKLEEICSLNTINEDKLNQKVLNFELQKNTKLIWTYGSQIKLYDQQTDQSQLHKKRQMQKTYTWRLAKLKNQIDIDDSLKQKIQIKLNYSKLTNIKSKPQQKSSEIIVSSSNYFILLSEILEVIIIEKSSLKIKFTFILNIPYDSKIMKIAISSTQKLISVLLFNQSIYVYNIYTQELSLYLKPTFNQKFISITFLDNQNQYMLASGTQSGKIALIPYSSVPQKKISFLKYHNNPVNIVETKNSFMLSCCEGGKIGVGNCHLTQQNTSSNYQTHQNISQRQQDFTRPKLSI